MDYLNTGGGLTEADLKPIKRKQGHYQKALHRGWLRYVVLEGLLIALALSVGSMMAKSYFDVGLLIVSSLLIISFRALSWPHMKQTLPVLTYEVDNQREVTNPPKLYNRLRLGLLALCLIGPFVFAYAHGLYKRAHPEEYPPRKPIFYMNQ